MRKWLFPVCVTCTAWLILQNFALLVLVLGHWVKS